MLQYEELKHSLLEEEGALNELAEAISIGTLKDEIKQLEDESAQEGFWNDIDNSNKVLQKLSGLKNKLTKYKDLKQDYEDTLTLIEMSDEEEDESMLDECTEGVERVK